MKNSIFRGILTGGGLLLGLWLIFRWLLPLTGPFLLGGLVALLAQPVVRALGRVGLPHKAASPVGVGLTLVFLACLGGLLLQGAVKGLGAVSQGLPDLQRLVGEGMGTLKTFLSQLAAQSPGGVRQVLTRTVDATFSRGQSFLDQAAAWLSGAVGAILGAVPGGTIWAAAALLSAFMLSDRWPGWRKRLLESPFYAHTLRPALGRLRQVAGGYILAQLKLMGITYLIVAAGFAALKIPNGMLIALAVAAVDALPVFGTGTVLLPWALISALQGAWITAGGLLVIYLAALLTRTFLEPRMVARHLGLDPFWTLVSFYVGFRLWGIGGMVLLPFGATCVKALTGEKPTGIS